MHLAALLLGQHVAASTSAARGQVQRHAAAVVAVAGLDDHRHADVLGGLPGSAALSAIRPSGTGTPTAVIRRLVRSLSRRCLRRWRWCGRSRRSRCGLLALAVAELDEVAVVQAEVRDAPVGGEATMRPCSPQVGAVDLRAPPARRPTSRGAVDGTPIRHAVAVFQRTARHLLRRGCGTPFVDAALVVLRVWPKPVGMPARLSSSITTCSSTWPIQVPSTRRCRKPPRSPTPAVVLFQRRQPVRRGARQAGQRSGGCFLQLADVEPDLQGGAVGPDVRAAQIGHAQQADVVEDGHRFRGGRGRIGGGWRTVCRDYFALRSFAGRPPRYATIVALTPPRTHAFIRLVSCSRSGAGCTRRARERTGQPGR